LKPSIFISYRRSETTGYALWLFSQLREWFDVEALFFDQSSVDAGERFPDSIQSGIASAKVVLVVIGPEWVSILNTRAKHNKVDYVLEEVAQALYQSAQTVTPTIIPVLVGDTPMPSADDLHPDVRDKLSDLFIHNAFEIKGTQSDMDSQLKQLRARIAEIKGVPSPSFRVPEEANSPWHVPFRRNVNFTGRDTDLTKLRDALEKSQGAALTALSGLGA